MSYETKNLFDTSKELGNVLDYSYLVDENFVLVVGLTSKGNIVVFHETKNQKTCDYVNLCDIYPEFLEYLLINLLPDASAVVLVLCNGKLLVIPIKYIINASWAQRQFFCNQPLLVNLELSSSNKCFNVPTSVVSYISKVNNRYNLLFSQKSGSVHVVDLELQKVVASINTEETINGLQLFDNTDKTRYLVVSQFTNKQYVWPLETDTQGIRETWAHFVPDNDLIPVLCQLNTHNDRKQLTLYFVDSGSLALVDDIKDLKFKETINGLKNSWFTYYSSSLIVFVTSGQELQYFFAFDEENLTESIELNCGLPCQPLGFVPLLSTVDGLARCLFINSTGFYSFEPIAALPKITMEYMNTRGYLKDNFVRLCEYTKNEQCKLYEDVLVESIKEAKPGYVDGIIYLGIELGIPLRKIASILKENQEFDALIPFLVMKSQKEAKDVEARDLLFDIYLHKLYKDGPTPALENSLYIFLIAYLVSEDVLKVFLQNRLLSCVLVYLAKSRSTVSQQIASYLVEVEDWKVFKQQDLLRVLVNLHWNAIDSATKQRMLSLVEKYTLALPELHEVVMVLNMADNSVRSDADFLKIAIVAGLSAQFKLKNYKLTRWSPVGCGSNFCVALSDDNSLWAWGEFVAGTTKAKNVSTLTGSKHISKSTVDLPPFKMSKTPRRIQLPRDLLNDPVGICDIKCGTEHVLLLDSSGHVYSYGKNRFGQCGVGHMDPVTEVTKIDGDFGTITVISAGNYHSGFIDDKHNVWLFGWAIHGQLGLNTIANVTEPFLITCLSNLDIVNLQLGMAHSIFLTKTGQVYGFGHMENGELIRDPVADPAGLQKQKSFKPLLLDLPEPMESISCNYFQGIGISKTAIYVWGECPQTLKMNAFWLKHKMGKHRTNPDGLDQWKGEGTSSIPRNHFGCKRIAYWNLEKQPAIRQISCGYNHCALLTEDGDIYTWGRALDKQLGHGTKTDKATPTKLVEPIDVKWKFVHCGRNMTIAVTTRGEYYTWGRNDRGQLGVKRQENINTTSDGAPKKYFLKSSTGNKRPIELPTSQCVGKPTPLLTLNVGIHHIAAINIEDKLNLWLEQCTQSDLENVSKRLQHQLICSPYAVKLLLKAGYLIPALLALAKWAEMNKTTIAVKQTSESTDSDNGNTPTSSASSIIVSDPQSLVETSYNLMNAHPAEEVKLVAVLLMMKAGYPILSRLAINQRLCKLVAGHIELPQSPPRSGRMSVSAKSPISSTPSTVLSASDYCSSGSLNRQKMGELNQKERQAMLKKARLPGHSKLQLLIKRATDLSDKFVFYSECGHYERRIVPTSVKRQQQLKSSNKAKLCSICLSP
ncbi:unnamed protein product [Bursaphelenchus okinawaensis]|uniref:Uncharacterized protein n=1 Tax=Bursaphelenchus okinawaensis TaxID=465554 RepID=A0A811KXX6_9BILA|nr:unnamed protein product [Bursaphelenchus okinawaensis]CAG9112826.1 unnamed protein product [Bursaphelenchus okinawaensis]